jgi:hypothetical protein
MLDLAQLTVDPHMPATVKGSLRSRRLGALPPERRSDDYPRLCEVTSRIV